jgi:RecA-family ATPase
MDRRASASGWWLILWAAKPKVGKSTIARVLAVQAARGESFLGLSSQKVRVLYLSLEERRADVRDHFRLLGA